MTSSNTTTRLFHADSESICNVQLARLLSLQMYRLTGVMDDRRSARHADGRWEASEEGSGKCNGNQAGAKQDETGHGHGEETSRSEFVPHDTPPIVMERLSPSRLSRTLARTERLSRSTVKRIARRCGNWNLTDALEQQRTPVIRTMMRDEVAGCLRRPLPPYCLHGAG
jgi:hypothetical protein